MPDRQPAKRSAVWGVVGSRPGLLSFQWVGDIRSGRSELGARRAEQTAHFDPTLFLGRTSEIRATLRQLISGGTSWDTAQVCLRR